MHTIKIKRKITSSQLRIAELKEFIGKQVEITVSESADTVSEKKAGGILAQFADQRKRNSEKKAWGIIADEKHRNH
ncbi:hypothetical protein [Gaoshiqia sediminis]|uniref:Uncharacterized protein n=1 Tax=Gaoshiqia sediminis TaxID=2986998 RepID=A0AA41YDF3_9BACT|nr:hypothetical protein [Gaoshiqia sediminis]MCW0484748.1 hypothetical protein [Gaoshiqia sediminis]